MTRLDEIVERVNAMRHEPATTEEIEALERELVDIELNARITAARAWAATTMISREMLRSVIVDLEIKRSKNRGG